MEREISVPRGSPDPFGSTEPSSGDPGPCMLLRPSIVQRHLQSPIHFWKRRGKMIYGAPSLIVKSNVASQVREDDELMRIQVYFCGENK